MKNFALPLFALIDQKKVDLRKPIPEELAEQLGLYFNQSLGIHSLTQQILQGGEQSYLIFKGVDEASVPKLFALADVQKTQLFEYSRDSEDEISLTPLAIDPNALGD